jgi:hypothetical protein
MVATSQIVFLGQMLARGGHVTYGVLDATLIFFLAA